MGFVLCELKFLSGISKSNSPEYACSELQRYCEQISNNWEELEELNLHHSDCENFSWKEIASDIKSGKIVKVIGANRDYWRYWRFERRVGHRSEISPIVNCGYMLCSIDIEQDSFEKKRGDDKKYMPDIELGPWDIL